MFDLEQSIANWRRHMLAAGITTPVPLDELEIHLREDIERQMQSGLSAQQAFGIAAKKIGQAPELKREFKKAGAAMEMQKIIKLAGLICIAVAIFCPLFMFLPFLLDHGLRHTPSPSAPHAVFFPFLLVLMAKMLGLAIYAATVAAIVLSWKYNHKFLPVIHSQPLRRAVGIMCYGGCLLWIRFGIFQLFPGGLHPRSIFLAMFIFGLEWALVAVLGGVGHGLEKAAARQDQPAGS